MEARGILGGLGTLQEAPSPFTAMEHPQGWAQGGTAARPEPFLDDSTFVYTSAMALSIKSDEADRLARELAAVTGESLTDAVTEALRERLEREQALRAEHDLDRRLDRLVAEVAAMPVLDERSADEIIGYDEHGLPT